MGAGWRGRLLQPRRVLQYVAAGIAWVSTIALPAVPSGGDNKELSKQQAGPKLTLFIFRPAALHLILLL